MYLYFWQIKLWWWWWRWWWRWWNKLSLHC